MATIRTCDRCGVSSTITMNEPGKVRAYTFDTYQPHHAGQPAVGVTVADLCEGCASQIRRAMTEPLPRAAK